MPPFHSMPDIGRGFFRKRPPRRNLEFFGRFAAERSPRISEPAQQLDGRGFRPTERTGTPAAIGRIETVGSYIWCRAGRERIPSTNELGRAVWSVHL